jgi:hypothetical protein
VVFLKEQSKYPNRFYPFRHRDWRIEPPEGTQIDGITVSTVMDACKTAFAGVT